MPLRPRCSLPSSAPPHFRLQPAAATKVTKTGDTVVDPEALTIQGGFGQGINGLAFQQDAVVTHRDYQYVAIL